MSEKLTRKEFFREFIRRSINAVSEFSAEFGPVDKPVEYTQQNALWSDLSPALLELEAARLGCDATDKDAVAQTIAAELSPPD